jgi:hypothetical protein
MQPSQVSTPRECEVYNAGRGEPDSDALSATFEAVDAPWLSALVGTNVDLDALWILNGWLVWCGAWKRRAERNDVGFYLSQLSCHPGTRS